MTPRLAARHDARPPPARPPAGAGAARIVRASHRGRWNAEPMADALLRAHLASGADPIDVAIEVHPLEEIGALEPAPKCVFVSGVAAYDFDEGERTSLERAVARGAVVLFESAGGGAFAASAEAMATSVLGDEPAPLIRHPLVLGENIVGGADHRRVNYRPFARELFGSRERTPRLTGLIIDQEVRVVFSREDLSHALLDAPTWGIRGYDTDSARGLLGNFVRYALGPRPSSPTTVTPVDDPPSSP